MEASHVVILRKNLVYLKEHLEVGEVLDHLYQEGIFTQPEYNRCKQAEPNKCGTVLEMLMQKGEGGYKSLCAVLDRSQPHVKEQLDRTSTEEGATSLLFVNKPKIEQQHREVIAKKEKIIAELKDEISAQREELDTKTKELEAARTAQEEDRERHLAELEEEKKKCESKLEKEINEKENVKKQMGDLEEKAKQLNDKANHLENALSDEKARYEAITSLTESSLRETNEQPNITEAERNENFEGCVYGDDSVCDVSQLMLLPCLHAACNPCIDNHSDQVAQGRLLCPCGRLIDSKAEDLPVDYVRRNEAAYNVSKDKTKTCTYKDHEHDVDATTYCQECDDYLCLECQTSHNERKKNRRHRRTVIQKMETVPIQNWLIEKPCSDHPDHKLELYDNNCKKPVCLLCSKGSHKQHDVEDVQFVYEQTTVMLEKLLLNHQLKLEAMRDVASVVEKHSTNLNQTADDLKNQVVSVHQDVAGKFLHRQKQLLQDTRLSLEGPKRAINEKLKIIYAAEKTVNSTIDYIQRAMESTTKTELISLSYLLQKKSDEYLNKELPADDTRDTAIRLSFQGQKALEEIIDEFGSVASCIHKDKLTDSQPTIRDLRREMNGLTEKLTLTSAELQKAKEEIAVDKERIRILQFICSFIERGPPMTYSRERVHWLLEVSADGQELINSQKRGGLHSDQFQNYRGTCSHLPLPLRPSPSSLTSSTYWETHARVQVKSEESVCPLLEMGVSEEGQVDTRGWVSEQTRAWAVSVIVCDEHPGICTQVCGQGCQCGMCYTDTLSNTPGTDVTLRYGCVVDVGKGRLAFIDVDREIVLHKFDVRFRQPLIPMFGVLPGLDLYTINM